MKEIDGPGMSVTMYFRPDEVELRLNAGIGIVAGITPTQTRQILRDMGGMLSLSTIEYLLDEAEAQGLI